VTDELENVLVIVISINCGFILIGSQRVQSLHLASFYIDRDMLCMALKHDDLSTCLRYIVLFLRRARRCNLCCFCVELGGIICVVSA